MFTGLVEFVGVVDALEPSAAGRRLVVGVDGWSHRPGPGESIAVDGCCLTVAHVADGRIGFDVVPQTLARTTLGDLTVGSRVNLEHAVTAQTLLGGHIVQGHVETVLRVLDIRSDAEGHHCRFELPDDLGPFVIPRGSIALAGVSLTVADLDPGAGWLEVALIPTTLEETTLGSLAPGVRVNVETDYLVRAVVLASRRGT